MRWLWAPTSLLLLGVLLVPLRFQAAHAQSTTAALFGYSGWATYYGIEDGVVAGDVMYDGTSYNPSDPTIAAASFLFPVHTWLRVCQPARCIIVQVRDRGLLDQNGVLVDLSRAAYALLFGQLGGKAWVSAYFSDPVTLGVDQAPVITSPLSAAVAAPPAAGAAQPPLAAATAPAVATPMPAPPATATPTPPPNLITVPLQRPVP